MVYTMFDGRQGTEAGRRPTPTNGTQGKIDNGTIAREKIMSMELTQADRDFIEELTTGTDTTLETFPADGFSFVRLADIEPEASAEKLLLGWEANTKARSYYRRYNEANHAEQEEHGLTNIERTARTDAEYNTTRKKILADPSILAILTPIQCRRVGFYYGIGETRYTVRQIAELEGKQISAVHNSIRKARKHLENVMVSV